MQFDSRCGRVKNLWALLGATFGLALSLVACGGGGGGVAPAAVVITAQPSDQSVQEGATAVFSVAADNAQSYQWQRQSLGAWADVPGARERSLSLPAVALTDHGAQFRVQAVGAAGTVTSSAATLSVTAQVKPAQITAAPVGVNRFVGESASFSVTATGTALAYRWQRSADGKTWNDIAGATLATLNLTDLSLADNGTQVRVIVSNTLGDVNSAAVVLTVEPPPAVAAFTTSPASLSVEVGQAASFTVVAVGQPAPALRWQRSRDSVSWTDIDGATQASYTLATTALSDDGLQLRAIATNASGSATSAVAKLQVHAKPVAPVITSQPLDVTTSLAGPASFTVAATGNPTPTVQWQHCVGGAGCTWANIVGATSETYVLSAVSTADEGRLLRAVLTNSAGTATTRAARLTVVGGTSLQLVTGEFLQGGHRDGALLEAEFAAPTTIIKDAAGNLIVADEQSHVIRKLDLARGVVSTLAGQPFEPGGEDGDRLTGRLEFKFDDSIAVDAVGNVYIVDGPYRQRVRKLSPDGRLTTLLVRDDLVGDLVGVSLEDTYVFGGIAADSAGSVYVGTHGLIYKIDGAGTVTPLAGAYSLVTSVSADGIGGDARFASTKRLVVVDGVLVVVENDRLRRVNLKTGVVTTTMGLPWEGDKLWGLLAPRGPGDVPYVGGFGGVWLGRAYVGTLVAGGFDFTATNYHKFIGIGVDKAGVIHAFNGGTIYRIERNGISTKLPIAPDLGGRTTFSAAFEGIAFSGSDMLLCVEESYGIVAASSRLPWLYAIDSQGNPRLLASSDLRVYGSFSGCPMIAVSAGGHVVIAAPRFYPGDEPRTDDLVYRISASAPPEPVSKLLRNVRGLAVDAQGNIYTSHLTHIKKTTPQGEITIFAGHETQSGHADGDASSARFNRAEGIVMDATGTLYVGDHHTIRRIGADGHVATVLGKAGEVWWKTGSDPRLGLAESTYIAIGGNDELIIANSHAVFSATIPGIRCDCGPRAASSNAQRMKR